MLMPTTSQHRGGSWPCEPGSGRGRRHGTSSTEPFDRWFRYPAGFASDYVSLMLDQLELPKGAWVGDCFAGSGVTGTAALARGFNFAGVEAHPLIAELAGLKLAAGASPEQIRDLAEEVKSAALPAPTQEVLDAETALVQRSFSPDVLGTLLGIRNLVQRSAHPARLYLKWALLASLRDVAQVKVGWPYQRPGVVRRPRYTDPRARVVARAEQMAADLESRLWEDVEARIITGDSRLGRTWAELPQELDACVASPPYLNNFDYADATRLELYFWGHVRTWSDMCERVRSDMLTATTQQSTVAEQTTAVEHLELLASPASQRILERVTAVRAEQAKRSRPKEYDRVIPAYFVAMHQILDNLLAHLRPGGAAIWLVGDSAPYGIHVDTPALIAQLAQDAGFDLINDVHLRDRGARWASNADRHNVSLSERIIVLRRP